MKIENENVVLADNEYRVGNFILRDGDDTISVTDLMGVVSFTLSKRHASGKMLKEMYDQRLDKAIQNYVSVMWNVLAVLPDLQWMTEVFNASVACVERNKSFYGIDENITDDDDAKILAEEKEFHEAGNAIVEGLDKIEDEKKAESDEN